MHYQPPKKPAAFCSAKRWHLSFKQIRAKGCLDSRKQCRHRNPTNECRYLVKNEQHPVWEQLRLEREKKKAVRMEAKQNAATND